VYGISSRMERQRVEADGIASTLSERLLDHVAKCFALEESFLEARLDRIGRLHATLAAKAELISRAAEEETGMDQQTKVNEMLPSQGNMINELFAQNYAASLRTAYAILRSKEDAEDAVQTAYRAAFRGFSKFRGELSFKTWITRITVNCCLIQLREHRARPLVALDNLLRPLEFNHTPPHPRCSAICGNFRWHTRGQHQDCRNPSTMSMSIP
jgi:hypothetical protein